MKKFLYLVQNKGELRKHLVKKISGPESDIILLTWRKPTNKGIFFPFSTWTEGRNRLYQEVFKTNYLYYIFIDGDVELKTTELCKTPNSNPWRIFEDLLLKFLPVVGVPSFFWYKQMSVEVGTIYRFDPIITAIHKEALNVLLPFYDGDDRESWWNSGVYFSHLVSLLYPNHTLQFSTIEVINKTHSLYPSHFDWEKVDNRFKACILDRRLKNYFQPYRDLSSFSNGRVEKKNRSYQYTQEELSPLFDFNSEIFRCRLIIQKNIMLGKVYAVCARSKLPYWGEYAYKKWGPKITTLVFEPLLVFYELRKRYIYFYREFKQNIRRIIWLFLKTTQPLRHRLGLKRTKLYGFKKGIKLLVTKLKQ